jgi:hypothetical protein
VIHALAATPTLLIDRDNYFPLALLSRTKNKQSSALNKYQPLPNLACAQTIRLFILSYFINLINESKYYNESSYKFYQQMKKNKIKTMNLK